MRGVEDSEYEKLGSHWYVYLVVLFLIWCTFCLMNLVGRERLRIDGDEDGELYKERAREIVGEVVRRGVFKTRKPEGKAGDH